MWQICIHKYNEISSCMSDTMNICCSKTKLLFPWTKYNFFTAIDILKLFSNFQCSIWASIINNNYFVVIIAIQYKQEYENQLLAVKTRTEKLQSTLQKQATVHKSVQGNANSTVNDKTMVWLYGTFLTDSKF